MSRPRVMAESQTLCIRMELKKFEELKSLARRLSYEQGKDVTLTDLIRAALDEVYHNGNKEQRAKE
jgi:hypothetical protein